MRIVLRREDLERRRSFMLRCARFAAFFGLSASPFFLGGAKAQAQSMIVVPTITTIAGTGTQGFTGDGGLATSAELGGPLSVVFDKAGNIYFTEYFNGCIRRIDVNTGIITLFVSGFNDPGGLVLDKAGANMYVADSGNNKIRKIVVATKAVSTFAGTGTSGFSGDGAAATNAKLSYPDGLVIDQNGNLDFADSLNRRIRQISMSTGIIHTIAGDGTNGFSGDGEAATSAELSDPINVDVDLNNNLYISDDYNHRIRKVDAATGIITTIVGNGTAGFSGDGGAATSAEIDQFHGFVSVDSAANITLVDQDNNRVRFINAATQDISTYAGTETAGYTGDGGPATSAELNGPQRIARYPRTGNQVLSDSGNQVLRQLTSPIPTFPSTAVGSSAASVNVYLQTTVSETISSIAVPSSEGNKQEYTTSVTGCAVDGTTVNPAGTVCTITVTFSPAYAGVRELPLVAQTSITPFYLALTGIGVGPQVAIGPGTTTSVAGTGVAGATGNGAAAAAATLHTPFRSYVDDLGNLYIADTANNVVRKVTASTGNISNVAGNGTACATPTAACGDGAAATSANLNAPAGVVVDAAQNLYIADTEDNRIRVVSPMTGLISTVAGTGAAGYSGDGNAASAATLSGPTGLGVDRYGNVAVADTGNHVVRFLSTTSGIPVITTVAGTGTACSGTYSDCGDGGQATSAKLKEPQGVAIDSAGDIYVADTGDNTVREVAAEGTISTIAGTGTSGYSADGSTATSSTLNTPTDVAIDGAGNVYFAEKDNNVVRVVPAAAGTLQTVMGTEATACATSTAACGDGGPSTAANLNTPTGVTLDSIGNVFITDSSDNRIRKVDVTTVNLNFATTGVQTTSTDSPKTGTVLNIGTSALTAPPPSTGANPVITTGFTIGNTSICPQLTSSSSAGTLAAGAECDYVVSFSPTVVQTFAGTLTLTDNSLNAASPTYATQVFNLNGVATLIPATTTDTAAGTGTYGAATSLITVTIPYAGTVAPTGAITMNGPSGDTVTVAASTCTASGGVLTCTANLPSANLPVGSNALTVSQAGDSNYSGSTGAGTLTINKAAATTTDSATGTGTYGAATSVVTVTIPYSGSTAPTGGVTVNGPGGDTVTVAASTCTAAAGTLTCVVNLPSANLPVSSNALTVSQAGDSNYSGSTGTGTLTINKAAATTTDSATGTGTYSAATLPVTVTIPYSGSTAPTGGVTVNGPSGDTVTIAVSFCTASGGVLTCAANLPSANLPVGANALTVSQAADANYSGSTGTGTLTISKVAATTTDSATGTGTYGPATSPVTVTIPYSGPAAPTGAVTVNGPSGDTVTVAALTCTAASGTMTCPVNLPSSNLPVGLNALSVSQAADGNYSGSTGAGTLLINPAGGATDSATGTGAYGAATSPVTVTIPYAGPVAPTGAVTVNGPGGTTVTVPASICTASSGVLTCIANLPTSRLPLGDNPVFVSQTADSNYATTTGTGTVTINQGPSPLAGSSSSVQNVTITQGTITTTLTATIPYTVAVAPSGAVSFTVAGGSSVAATCSFAGSPVICTATYPTASFVAGTYPITATQAADANYVSGSASATLTVETTSPSPLLSIGSSVSNVSITQGTASATLMATIAYIGTAPTGAVTFEVADGTGSTVTATCTSGSSPLTCTASYPTASLATGNYTITATEAADATYAQGNVTGTLSVTPTAAGPGSPIQNTGSNVSNVTVGYGTQSATLTATIAYSGTAPTGAVTFQLAGGSGGAVTATCTTGASPLTCTAPYPTSNLGVGSYTITANEAADGNYGAGFAQGTLTVTSRAPANNDTVTGTGTFGASTSLVTATIPYTGAVTPTGNVTVNGPSGDTVTVPASDCTAAASILTCTANLPSSNLPVGSNALTVSQAADPNYGETTGTGTLTLNPAGGGIDSVTGTGTYSSPTSPVTVTIPYSGDVAPTGAITVNAPSGDTVAIAASTCTAAPGTLTCAANLPSANLPVGANALTVSQAADSDYTASAGTGTLTVNRAPATTGDTATGTGTYGVATTPVTVSIPYNGSAALTGAVTVNGPSGDTLTVSASTCTATSGVLTCTANLPTANLPVGSNALTISQAGDANYSGSTGTGTVTLNKASTTDSVTGTGTYGSTISPVTVTIPYSGAAAPTGAITVNGASGDTVSIAVSACSAAGGVLTCAANLPSANLPVGANALTVSQAADSNYLGSTSTGTLTLGKAVATTTDSATGTGTYGVPTTPVTVTIPYSGTTPPWGAVTVNGPSGDTVTIAASTCTASGGALTCAANLPSANLPVGSNALTVSQAADSNYSGSTGTGTLTINKIAATTTDSVTGTGTYGAATSPVTVTIPYSGSTAPTGAITVNGPSGDTVTMAASTCAASGGALICAANLPSANLPVGANALTVSQAADGNHGTTTGTGTLTIAQSIGDSVTVTPSPVTIGSSVATATLKATVSYTGASAPTGGLSFTVANGTSVVATCIGASSPLICTAMYPTASLGVGTYVITAKEGMDANYAAASGTGLLIVVSDFTFTNKGVTYQTVVPGDTVSYTFALAPVYPNYPGQVTLSVIGYPPNASCTVTPNGEPATAGPQTITLTVATANAAATTNKPGGSPWRTGSPIVLACLLPLFLRHRIRKQLGGVLCALIILIGGLAAVAGLTGCAQHNGFFDQGPGDYTITVTATSGGVSKSASVTLTIQ